MAQHMVLKTTKELYPPKAAPEVVSLTNVIVAFKPDNGAPFELRRALTLPERESLQGRKRLLDVWMQATTTNEAKLAINEMFQGFGDTDKTEDERDMRNENYAFACRERTPWGLFRACMKFRMGEVKPEDVGEKTLSRTWRPSSAQLNQLAKNIEKTIAAEHALITGILRAGVDLALEPPRPKSGAEQAIASAAAGMSMSKGAVQRHLIEGRARKEIEDAEEQIRREKRNDQNRRTEVERVNRTYTAAGLEPPEWKPDEVPVTLQFKLKYGWKIEDVQGVKTLTSPPQRAGAKA